MADAINLSRAHFEGSPNISAWPITTSIQSVEVNHRGVIVSPVPARWPDAIPVGWDGPIQDTLWMGLKLSDGWHVAAVHTFWRGRGTNNDDAGGDVFLPDQIEKNWLYAANFGALQGKQPKAGDQVAFFIAAGGQRFDIAPVETVKERSNVVLVTWPSQPKTFTFTADVPPVVTDPPSDPPPPPPPPPDATAIARLGQRVDALEKRSDEQDGELLALKLAVTSLTNEHLPPLPPYEATVRIFGFTIPIESKPKGNWP